MRPVDDTGNTENIDNAEVKAEVKTVPGGSDITPAAQPREEKRGLGPVGYVGLIAAAGLLFISVCGIVLMFTKAFFHSDSAFFVQLALEQIKSGKLFPPDMCYST